MKPEGQPKTGKLNKLEQAIFQKPETGRRTINTQVRQAGQVTEVAPQTETENRDLKSR